MDFSLNSNGREGVYYIYIYIIQYMLYMEKEDEQCLLLIIIEFFPFTLSI